MPGPGPGSLTHSLAMDPQETTRTLMTPDYKLARTTEHNALQICPRRQCVYLRVRHLYDGVWSPMLSVNLGGGPPEQKLCHWAERDTCFLVSWAQYLQ